ncbi:SCL-interrupting locus protein homolog isoform X2 [Pseudoliparis swirei]|uniref:SCL-interrupting locus protein homolog isoform X2 n=1 Tax=Pseudoliparis swirei TaxID=2059687 RepID=UPI0024BE99BA|nr:SCL-interrupting locus protein homolog isoform X2 [Pseudoliparis swirei]
MSCPVNLQDLPSGVLEAARGRPFRNSLPTLSFPRSRSALWDGRAAGEKLRLQLCARRKPCLLLMERALRLAQRHAHHSNKPRLLSFLLGSVSVDADEEGLTVTLDRFDPGRDQAGSCRVPSAPLPGDVLVPCWFSTQTEPPEALVQSEAELHLSFKADAASFVLRWSSVCPSVSVEVQPVRPLPVIPTALLRSLTGVQRGPAPASRQRGFLTMDQTRKLLLLLESDPKASSLPLVGLWLSGVAHASNPQVWAWCVRYLYSSSLQDRVLSETRCFLLVLFASTHRAPQFFQCRGPGPGPAPPLDYQLLTASQCVTLYQVVPGEDRALRCELGPEERSRQAEVFREARTSFSGARGSGAGDQDSGVEDLSPRPSPSPHPPPPQTRRVQPSVPELSLLIDGSVATNRNARQDPGPAHRDPPAPPTRNTTTSSAPRAAAPPHLHSTPNSNLQEPCCCCSTHTYDCTSIFSSPGLHPAPSHHPPPPPPSLHPPPPPPPPSSLHPPPPPPSSHHPPPASSLHPPPPSSHHPPPASSLHPPPPSSHHHPPPPPPSLHPPPPPPSSHHPPPPSSLHSPPPSSHHHPPPPPPPSLHPPPPPPSSHHPPPASSLHPPPPPPSSHHPPPSSLHPPPPPPSSLHPPPPPSSHHPPPASSLHPPPPPSLHPPPPSSHHPPPPPSLHPPPPPSSHHPPPPPSLHPPPPPSSHHPPLPSSLHPPSPPSSHHHPPPPSSLHPAPPPSSIPPLSSCQRTPSPFSTRPPLSSPLLLHPPPASWCGDSPSPAPSRPSCVNVCCDQVGVGVPPDTYQLLLHQDQQLRLLQAQVQMLLEAQGRPAPRTASIAVGTGASLFWGDPVQSPLPHQEVQAPPPSSSHVDLSTIGSVGGANVLEAVGSPGGQHRCSVSGLESPVLGESASMYGSEGEQRRFYHDLMSQLSSRLQESDRKQEVEDESGRRRQRKPSAGGDPVLKATVRQLQQLGVHLDHGHLNESQTRTQQTVESSSTLASINPAAVLSRLSVPDASLLVPEGSVDLSLEANAIALRYLSDSQLSRLCVGGHAPSCPGPASNHSPLSPSNMSLATRKYMRRYGLIEEEEEEEATARQPLNVKLLPQSQLIRDLRPTMQLLAGAAHKENRSSRRPSLMRASGSVGNILDLQRLRQLPKLF